MPRMLVIYFLVLAAPFVVLLGWRVLRSASPARRTLVVDGVLLLVALGLVAGLFGYVLTRHEAGGDQTDRVWIPSYITADGVLIDGFFVPADEYTSRAAARAARGLPPAPLDRSGDGVTPTPVPSPHETP